MIDVDADADADAAGDGAGDGNETADEKDEDEMKVGAPVDEQHSIITVEEDEKPMDEWLPPRWRGETDGRCKSGEKGVDLDLSGRRSTAA